MRLEMLVKGGTKPLETILWYYHGTYPAPRCEGSGGLSAWLELSSPLWRTIFRHHCWRRRTSEMLCPNKCVRSLILNFIGLYGEPSKGRRVLWYTLARRASNQTGPAWMTTILIIRRAHDLHLHGFVMSLVLCDPDRDGLCFFGIVAPKGYSP